MNSDNKDIKYFTLDTSNKVYVNVKEWIKNHYTLNKSSARDTWLSKGMWHLTIDAKGENNPNKWEYHLPYQLLDGVGIPTGTVANSVDEIKRYYEDKGYTYVKYGDKPPVDKVDDNKENIKSDKDKVIYYLKNLTLDFIMNLDKGIIEDIGDYTIYVDNTKTIKWGKVGLVDIEYKDKTLYMSDWIESDEELNYKIEKAIEKVNSIKENMMISESGRNNTTMTTLSKEAMSLLNSRRVKMTESKKFRKGLNEGPGAGYTITSKGYDMQGSVSDVISVVHTDKGYVIKALCDFTGKVKEFDASSYYSGTGDVDNLSIHCDSFEIRIPLTNDEVIEEITNGAKEITKDNINVSYLSDAVLDVLYTSECSFVYGGGYVHSKYDGQVNDYDHLNYDPYYFDDIKATIYLTNQEDIDRVDRMTQGYGYETVYTVFDEDGDIVDSFESEEDAINFAQENDYLEVREEFQSEDWEGNIDSEFGQTVWTGADDLIKKSLLGDDDDDIEESLKESVFPDIDIERCYSDIQYALKSANKLNKFIDEDNYSTIYLNIKNNIKKIMDEYDLTEEDINEDLYKEEDEFVQYMYEEGIISMSIESLVDWIKEELSYYLGESLNEQSESAFNSSYRDKLIELGFKSTVGRKKLYRKRVNKDFGIQLDESPYGLDYVTLSVIEMSLPRDTGGYYISNFIKPQRHTNEEDLFNAISDVELKLLNKGKSDSSEEILTTGITNAIEKLVYFVGGGVTNSGGKIYYFSDIIRANKEVKINFDNAIYLTKEISGNDIHYTISCLGIDIVSKFINKYDKKSLKLFMSDLAVFAKKLKEEIKNKHGE